MRFRQPLEQNLTYNHSFFFRRLNTIQKKVSFCWIAFRFLRKRDCPEVYNFYSNEKLQKKCVNPLDFNFPESHVLLVHSTLPNCRFRYPEKRKNDISQMRLRSVFKMRTSILNTATTEQMGYRVFSFFVYTKFTN